jgi:hypothetical protein
MLSLVRYTGFSLLMALRVLFGRCGVRGSASAVENEGRMTASDKKRTPPFSDGSDSISAGLALEINLSYP